ncbi:MAG: PIG-L family deacetylase [Planctomycetota bacterium]
MKHRFPPLFDKAALAPPVLVVVAHPDDEVIGCGAMMAWHRRSGHPVTVVHVTDGAAGDPEGKFGDITEVRRREGRAALAALGVDDVRTLGLPDGGVAEAAGRLDGDLRTLFAALQPATLYSFFYAESHRDHRAVARAVAGAADALPPACRVLLFGVNQPVSGGVMFDVSELAEEKRRALACYASQLAYNDFAAKVLHRDHAATVNVEDPAVQHAEVFADLVPGRLPAVREATESVWTALYGADPEEDP